MHYISSNNKSNKIRVPTPQGPVRTLNQTKHTYDLCTVVDDARCLNIQSIVYTIHTMYCSDKIYTRGWKDFMYS